MDRVIFYGLSSNIFIRDFVSTKYSNIIFLISGVFYITTLWTAWIFNFNMMPYISGFGFLPLLLLSIYLLLKEWSWKRVMFFILSSILFSSSSVIATLFFVNIVLILFFFVYFGWIHKARIKNILLVLGIFLLLQCIGSYHLFITQFQQVKILSIHTQIELYCKYHRSRSSDDDIW
jgi:hypothetical protein